MLGQTKGAPTFRNEFRQDALHDRLVHQLNLAAMQRRTSRRLFHPARSRAIRAKMKVETTSAGESSRSNCVCVGPPVEVGVACSKKLALGEGLLPFHEDARDQEETCSLGCQIVVAAIELDDGTCTKLVPWRKPRGHRNRSMQSFKVVEPKLRQTNQHVLRPRRSK